MSTGAHDLLLLLKKWEILGYFLIIIHFEMIYFLVFSQEMELLKEILMLVMKSLVS
jgi:hypothetical protein